jgi:N-acetylglutamate synthase-like GNAT family acetyltransferase
MSAWADVVQLKSIALKPAITRAGVASDLMKRRAFTAKP